jgi:hypothetical protein
MSIFEDTNSDNQLYKRKLIAEVFVLLDCKLAFVRMKNEGRLVKQSYGTITISQHKKKQEKRICPQIAPITHLRIFYTWQR